MRNRLAHGEGVTFFLADEVQPQECVHSIQAGKQIILLATSDGARLIAAVDQERLSRVPQHRQVGTNLVCSAENRRISALASQPVMACAADY